MDFNESKFMVKDIIFLCNVIIIKLKKKFNILIWFFLNKYVYDRYVYILYCVM